MSVCTQSLGPHSRGKAATSLAALFSCKQQCWKAQKSHPLLLPSWLGTSEAHPSPTLLTPHAPTYTYTAGPTPLASPPRGSRTSPWSGICREWKNGPVRPRKEGGPQARRTPTAKTAGSLPPGQTRHNVQRFLGRGGHRPAWKARKIW